MAQDNDVLRSTEVGLRTFFLGRMLNTAPNWLLAESALQPISHGTPRPLVALRPCWTMVLSIPFEISRISELPGLGES